MDNIKDDKYSEKKIIESIDTINKYMKKNKRWFRKWYFVE